MADILKSPSHLSCFAISLVIGATASVWILGWDASVSWGDDWAGYLLQAHAISLGDMRAELVRNTAVVVASDVQFGPYAYPWGYPVLLAAVGALGNWHFVTLKIIGGISLCAFGIASYFLARQYLTAAASCSVALLAALQPDVVTASAELISDVPFAALSILSLLGVLVQQAKHSTLGSFRWGGAVSIAALNSVTFAVRSNGIMLMPLYPLMLILCALEGKLTWRRAAILSAVFAVSTAMFLAAYFAYFPDGSLSVASYLTTDLRSLARRCYEHIVNLGASTPFNLVPGKSKILLLVPFFSLVILAALRRPRVLAIILTYQTLHLLLLTIFPFDGGPRYYFPLLAPLFILFSIACKDLIAKTPVMLHLTQNAAPGAWNFALAAIVAGIMFIVARQGQVERLSSSTIVEGPGAALTLNIFDHVRQTAPTNAVIAFWKPRVFRLHTGHRALLIANAQALGPVDWYVFYRGDVKDGSQIEEKALIDNPGRRFHIAHESKLYRIYVRD